jgi:hypothetical protein
MSFRLRLLMRRRKPKIFLIALTITVILVLAFFYIGRGGPTQMSLSAFDGSKNPCYMVQSIDLSGASYFYSDARISISVINSFAQSIKNFTIFASLDNATWKQVPLTDSYNYVELGVLPLNSYNCSVFMKIEYQPLNITAPQGDLITFDRLIPYFGNRVKLDPIMTPQMTVVFILVVITAFSFILQMIDFFYPNITEKEKRKHQNSMYPQRG